LLIKVGPDLGDDQIDLIGDLALDLELDGIVSVNTTLDPSGLKGSAAVQAAAGAGGISGPPVRDHAIHFLRRLYQRVGDRVVLISVGGIDKPSDAWERILAGATLVQAYTGFVYGGPFWPSRINRGLSRLVRDVGASSIQDLVGAKADSAGETPLGGRKADSMSTAPSVSTR
jgi:dihydroorotate dehydrogenase